MPSRVYSRRPGRRLSRETEGASTPFRWRFGRNATTLVSLPLANAVTRYTSCKLVNRGYTGLLRFVYRFIRTVCFNGTAFSRSFVCVEV